ncbi:glycosyltransferase [Sciscionella marina]|uniref:glycosyltransferase n=1 Tax=Sciscionella marina TaxID=508770 RepID=UPI000371DAF6|nr:glycosyltransferase [Sciscionella marina]
MRVLFTSAPGHGHVRPLLPLAGAARSAGHEVLFATDADFLAAPEKAGLRTMPAGGSIQEAFAAATGSVPRRPPSGDGMRPVLGAVFGDAMPRRFLADLTPILERERPDLVVYEQGNIGGGFAAKLAGIPGMRHGFGRVSPSDLGAEIQRNSRALAAEIGIGEPPQATDPFIDICPESAQAPEALATTDRIPLRPGEWHEPVVRTGHPLLYLTFGTAFGDVEVLRTAIAGLSTLDAEVLVATGPAVDPATLGAVPDNVRLETWVSQDAVLRASSLAVHHGGSGTMLGAFAAGIPQLVLPQGADQFTNAETVHALGLGTILTEPGTITEAARHLLTTPAVAAAARTMAAEVAAMPAPDELAARLPEFA